METAAPTETEEISTSDDVEAIMTGLCPVEPSSELFAKLSHAFETGLTDAGMVIDISDIEEASAIGEVLPVTVPEDRLRHWTKLMDQAAREVTEERLMDLKAASPTEFKLMRWLMSVENTSPEVQKESLINKIPPQKRLKLWAMSAAATFMLIAGVLSFYPQSGGTDRFVQNGDLNRETMNIVDEGVYWNVEKGAGEQKFHVDYKDSLKVVDKDGSEIIMSCVAAQKVAVPVEIY